MIVLDFGSDLDLLPSGVASLPIFRLMVLHPSFLTAEAWATMDPATRAQIAALHARSTSTSTNSTGADHNNLNITQYHDPACHGPHESRPNLNSDRNLDEE